MTVHYFSPDYPTARARFRELAEARAGALEARGPDGQPLTVDIAWFGDPAPRRAFVHASGLHGVEGFLGSAAQLQLLESLPPLPPDCALILVHALNPYGMAWLRRVNEENVDLNRNALDEPDAYSGVPEGYTLLEGFLNPTSPPGFDFFLARALGYIARYGFAPLKQAVARGQYEHPMGLFYGGARLQQSLERYTNWLVARLSGAESAVFVDVHTGLGSRGKETLLVRRRDDGGPSGPDHFDRVAAQFGDRVTSLEDGDGPAYATSGSLSDLAPRLLPDVRVDYLVQEIGTAHPLRVLHALREENRWHLHGDGGRPQGPAHQWHPAKRALKEAFCPRAPRWRAAALARCGDLAQRAATAAFDPDPAPDPVAEPTAID